MVLDVDSRRLLSLAQEDGVAGAPLARGGGGPGEVQRPLSITGVRDEVWVLDGGKRSLERFNVTGEYTGTIPVGATAFTILPWPGGALLSVFRPDRWPVLALPDGRLLPVSLGRAPGSSALSTPTECGRLGALDTLVILSCRDRPAWFAHDTGQGLVRQVLSAREPVARSDSVIEAYVARVTASMIGMPDSTVREIAEMSRADAQVRQSFGKIQADVLAGLITVLDQDNEDWSPTQGILLLYSGDGRFVADVVTPRVWVDHVVAGGSVFAIEESGDGIRTVVRYRFTWPAALEDYLGRYR
jgi:hypothetical protein